MNRKETKRDKPSWADGRQKDTNKERKALTFVADGTGRTIDFR